MGKNSHGNPRSAAINMGSLSIIKNRKVGVAIGLVLMGVGAWGMLLIGSDTLETVREGEYSEEQSKEFQIDSYAFMFGMIAGLIILLYSAVSNQAEHAYPRR